MIRAAAAGLVPAGLITAGLITAGIIAGVDSGALSPAPPANAVHDLIGVQPSDTNTPALFDDTYRAFDGGCHNLDDAAGFNTMFDNGIGPLIAFDGIQEVSIGRDRNLWIVQDGFLDWPDDGPATTLDDAQYASTVAVVFDALDCATVLVQEPNTFGRVAFEYGKGDVTYGRFFWPLGAVTIDDVLHVWWAEMRYSPEQPAWLDGIVRDPVSTWYATYDPTTLERTAFDPAPAPGITPQWGFEAVDGNDGHIYLYGNANLLNLAMSGGYDNGPHPATAMYVARVDATNPTGPSEYFDGHTWSPRATTAAPVSTRGYVANMMHPTRVGDQYVSATLLDEFWGDTLIVETADRPEGPWTTVSESVPPPAEGTVSYHPTVHEDGADQCTVTVTVSFNAGDWPHAIEHPHLYRPKAFDVPLCGDGKAVGGVDPG